MGKLFEQDLQQLRTNLNEMAEITKSMILDVIQALVKRDNSKFATIRANENRVNQLEMKLDDIAWKAIALRQPMGMDLRFIIAVIKINPLLERMADEAINILKKVEYLITVPLLKPLIDTPRMCDKVIWAVSASMSTVYSGDTDLAREVCWEDHSIDELRDQIYRELMTYMQESPDNIRRALNLLFIAKSLERIGDMATDIAEDAIYLHQAKDIRHHAEDDDEFKKHALKAKDMPPPTTDTEAPKCC